MNHTEFHILQSGGTRSFFVDVDFVPREHYTQEIRLQIILQKNIFKQARSGPGHCWSGEVNFIIFFFWQNMTTLPISSQIPNDQRQRYLFIIY